MRFSWFGVVVFAVAAVCCSVGCICGNADDEEFSKVLWPDKYPVVLQMRKLPLIFVATFTSSLPFAISYFQHRINGIF